VDTDSLNERLMGRGARAPILRCLHQVVREIGMPTLGLGAFDHGALAALIDTQTIGMNLAVERRFRDAEFFAKLRQEIGERFDVGQFICLVCHGSSLVVDTEKSADRMWAGYYAPIVRRVITEMFSGR